MTSTFTINICIHDYHIYKDIWNPPVGETVNCEREPRNARGPIHSSATEKQNYIVGHVPHTISCMCTRFWWVTGPRRHSDDLMQEGLELLCKYTFTGPDDVTKIVNTSRTPNFETA